MGVGPMREAIGMGGGGIFGWWFQVVGATVGNSFLEFVTCAFALLLASN